MEKYYDGDQETFFREAHVINPFNKPNIITKPRVSHNDKKKPVYFVTILNGIFTGEKNRHRRM